MLNKVKEFISTIKVDKFVQALVLQLILWIMLLITFLIMGLAITGCNNKTEYPIKNKYETNLYSINPVPLSRDLIVGTISLTYNIDSVRVLNNSNQRYYKTMITYISNIQIKKEIHNKDYEFLQRHYFIYKEQYYFVSNILEKSEIKDYIIKVNKSRFHKNHLFVFQ